MGCVARRAPRMLVESPASYAAIYAFSDLQRQRALDYKPGGDVSNLDPYLAPLIVQEVRTAGRYAVLRSSSARAFEEHR